MLESFSTKAVLTKVKAMYGHRLTEGDYEQLLHKPSVPACAAYLKNQTYYGQVMRDVQETQIHRGALEALLNKAFFEQCTRLARFAGRQNRFSRFFIMRQEVRHIINAVRLLEGDSQNEFVQSVPGYLLPYLSFDVLSLGRAQSFEELLGQLAATPYHKVLLPLRAADGGAPPLPLVEQALYTQYYKAVFRLIGSLYRGKTAQELTTIFSTQAELYNLRVILRMKRHFDVPPEDLRLLLLDVRGRLPRHLIAELVRAPDAGQALALLAASKYGSYFGPDDFLYVEYSAGSIRYHLSKRLITFSQNPITAFVAFTVLREIEIENLVNIIEGVRYQLDVSQIRPLLIRS